MRAVILLNPLALVENAKHGPKYAEASIGFDYNGAIDDKADIAAHLRVLSDAIDSTDAGLFSHLIKLDPL